MSVFLNLNFSKAPPFFSKKLKLIAANVQKAPIDLPILFKHSLSTVNYHHTMIKFDWLGAGILLIPIGKGLVKGKNAGVECFLLIFPRERKFNQRHNDSLV